MKNATLGVVYQMYYDSNIEELYTHVYICLTSHIEELRILMHLFPFVFTRFHSFSLVFIRFHVLKKENTSNHNERSSKQPLVYVDSKSSLIRNNYPNEGQMIVYYTNAPALLVFITKSLMIHFPLPIPIPCIHV